MKKGYFFLVDVFFAVFILSAGYLLIRSGSTRIQNEVALATPLENSMQFLSTIRVNEICPNSSTCTNTNLSDAYLSITNMNQSLLDALGELYKKNNLPEASSVFIGAIAQGEMMDPQTTGFELIINDTRIYPDYDTVPEKNMARDIISSKRLIFGSYDVQPTGEVIFWGPYIAEVNAWQK